MSVHAAQRTLAIELPDGDTKIVPRINDHAIRSLKGQRPRVPAGAGMLDGRVAIVAG